MPIQPNIDQVIDRLGRDQANAQKTLDEFRVDFDKTPRYALEWSGNAFNAVAVIDYVTKVLTALEYIKAKDSFTQAEADILIRHLDQHFIQRIKGAGISGSSNGGHRMMAQAQADVSADWYGDVSWGTSVSRGWVVDVIQAQVPPAQPSSE